MTAFQDGDRSRLFFALWPPDEARPALQALAGEIARETEGKPTRAETLHVTLLFVGDVAAEDTPRLEAIGHRLARAVKPFLVEFDRIGQFRRARVAWLGAGTVPDALAGLAKGLHEAASGEGFALESRPYTPHLTLARHTRANVRERMVERVAWRVVTFSLVTSKTLASGAVYSDVARFELSGR